MEALPTAEGRDVSADGSVVVGGAVWTQSGGLHAPLGPCCQSAQGVSPDGGTITGWTSTSNGIRAFRWTAATGVQALGTLGGPMARAFAVSDNGSVIVGRR